ncbi:unnamed protein product, partial [marine sediment metagenome]
ISPLQGSIVLKSGFIETFFNYIYYKSPTLPVFEVRISGTNNNIYTDLSTKFADGKAYGIITINDNNIVMQYSDTTSTTTTTT